MSSSTSSSSIRHLIVNHGQLISSQSSGVTSASSIFQQHAVRKKLTTYLMETLSLNMKEVSDLLDIGAIYHLPHLEDDESIANKLGNLSIQQQEQEQQQPTHQTQALKSKPSAAAKLAKQPIPKRIMKDRYLTDQDYIRVHLKPRRYFNANKIDWAKRILYETSDYLVIDKPNGVPSHATMDNGKENVLECIRNVLRDRSTSLQEYSSSASALQQSVNLEDEQDDDSESEGQTSIPLFLPQRLDVETSGLMLIARNSMMIRMMNDWLKRDLIRKRYKALLTFNVDVKDDEEIAFIQDSIFTVQPLAPCPSSSSSASKFKLAGYFQEGDILTSYLKKSTVAPKFYYWSTPFTVEEVHCHPMLKQNIESPSEDMNSSLFSFQDCHSKVIKVSRPVIKSKQEWLRCVKSLENPGRGSESDDINEQLDRQKVHDAVLEWMRDHPPIEDDHHDPKAMNYVGFQEVVLELITGRTHQVRGQLQSLQWHPEVMKLQDRISHFHIAGDNLYPGASTQSSRVEHDEEGDEEAEESMSMGKQRYVGDKTSIAVSRSCPHLALQACSIAINFKVKKVEQQLHFQINQPWWQSIFS